MKIYLRKGSSVGWTELVVNDFTPPKPFKVDEEIYRAFNNLPADLKVMTVKMSQLGFTNTIQSKIEQQFGLGLPLTLADFRGLQPVRNKPKVVENWQSKGKRRFRK